MTAHEQRHGAIAVGLQRGLGREHVGREAVVDELDQTRRDRCEWHRLGRPREPSGRRRHPGRVVGLGDAQRPQHGPGHGGIADVVLAGQAERADPGPPNLASAASTHCT